MPPRGQRPPFVVRAGALRVEVVGTRFRVARVSGEVRVDTFEGKVRVVAREGSTLVGQGASFTERETSEERETSQPLPEDPKRQSSSATAHEPVLGAKPLRVKADDLAEPTPEPSRHLPVRGPPRPARERFEQAARLEASAPKRALQVYAGLVAERGAWSAPALYAMGRLQLERGRRDEALDLLRRYLREHPRGENAADVRALVGQMRGVPE